MNKIKFANILKFSIFETEKHYNHRGDVKRQKAKTDPCHSQAASVSQNGVRADAIFDRGSNVSSFCTDLWFICVVYAANVE